MKNPETYNVIKLKMQDAITSADSEGFVKALDEMAEEIQNSILADVKSTQVYNSTMEDLFSNKKYNLRPLSTEEDKFYKAITDATVAIDEKLLPKTVYDRVFEDLKADHPLLSKIQFVNTTGVTEWSMRNGDVAAAQWGKLCDDVKKQLDAAFKTESLMLNKLSAFVNICKAMLVLGPVWLDRFVREILSESIALGLENAVVAGTGIDQPIGMMKNLAGSIDPVTGYSDKTAKAITSLSVGTLGTEIMAPMTKNGTKIISVENILFIVNPLDYWTSIYGHLAFRTPEGNWVLDKTSIGATLVQSVAVPAGKMIVGKAKNYFMGLGMNTKVDYSDEYRFLEDDRVYIAKLYGHGKPVDNDSFMVFDISGVAAPTP